MRSTLTAILAIVLALAAVDARAQSERPIRRYSLVVGANDGGPDRITLRYASGDARSFASVMSSMGGVSEHDTVLLIDPDRASFAGAFDDLAARIGAVDSDQRVEFFFYYSGHSDENGLLLPDGQMGYDEVRTLIHAMPADVRIGVLDSCASGAFTRIKGGEFLPPFMVDESTQVRGHAFLMSSSADEAAQESDAIQASFFTHYLVTGLRGAADSTGDRRVTLNEAYRFAFDETLQRTESTLGGPQHPAYDIQLVGTGDIVLTDLNQTSAVLVLADSLEGRFFVRDEAGFLVAELYKPAGRQVELGLAPGRYDILLEIDGAPYSAQVQLDDQTMTVLESPQLVAQNLEATDLRGGEPVIYEQAEIWIEEPLSYRHLPFAMALVTPVDTNSIEDKVPVLNNFALNWLYGTSGRVDGLQLSFFGNRALFDVNGLQMGMGFNLLDGELRGLQVAVGFNQGRGWVRGLQMATGLNIASAEVVGGQCAVGGNFARGDVAGAQASVGFNAAYGLAGLQAAAGFNYASDLVGVQLGSVNWSGDVAGAQLGVLNLAGGRVRGLQFGVVNWADEADVSIGLVGATRAGGIHPMVWSSDTAAVTVGLRFDANVTYTLFSAGFRPFGDVNASFFGYGLGVKFPDLPHGLRLELDVTNEHILYDWEWDNEHYTSLSKLRLMLRWQPTRALALFAGPTLNVWFGDGENPLRRGPSIYSTDTDPDVPYDNHVDIWPGFVAGVSLF